MSCTLNVNFEGDKLFFRLPFVYHPLTPYTSRSAEPSASSSTWLRQGDLSVNYWVCYSIPSPFVYSISFILVFLLKFLTSIFLFFFKYWAGWFQGLVGQGLAWRREQERFMKDRAITLRWGQPFDHPPKEILSLGSLGKMPTCSHSEVEPSALFFTATIPKTLTIIRSEAGRKRNCQEK